jgi:riboflavin kinase/FMN adenylyltransferase
MRLIRGLKHLRPLEKGCVLTIGNFDGVHLGHQEVIRKLAHQGEKLDLPVVVLVFEPQPLEYFLGEDAPTRITRLREKVIQLKQLPIDDLLILKFDRYLADYDAELFVKEILLEKLKVKYLAVGDDFHFGKARRGNFAMLREMGSHFGFHVNDTHSFIIEGNRVSSTLVRDMLGEGEFTEAEILLGRPYSVCGRVIHGEKRGRTIGFPTANVQLFRKRTPIEGVFAVTMSGIGAQQIPGVANVGVRPTFEGGTRVLLETHLFNFNQEIYGQYVEVNFRAKIRNEMRFHLLDDLTRQIQQDAAEAKQILADLRLL